MADNTSCNAESPQQGQPGFGPLLYSAPRLLTTLWEEESRPSLRSLRSWQKARIIPSVKIGRLVYFDLRAVKAALEKRTLRGKV